LYPRKVEAFIANRPALAPGNPAHPANAVITPVARKSLRVQGIAISSLT
jgi:hypothetical protein